MRFRMRSRARLFTTVVIAAGAAATLDAARTPALAQGYFFWGGETEPRAEPPRERRQAAQPQRPAARKKVSRTAPEGAAARQAKPEAAQLERPLFVIASIADQHVSIYNHRGLVARSAISTGIAGHPTPKGIFSIIGRERYHRSNIYSGAPMPFMQRITWSGIAMHLGVVPGHPASHGCIRLPAAFAARLWGMTRIGERVVISPHDISPSEFDHPLLPRVQITQPPQRRFNLVLSQRLGLLAQRRNHRGHAAPPIPVHKPRRFFSDDHFHIADRRLAPRHTRRRRIIAAKRPGADLPPHGEQVLVVER